MSASVDVAIAGATVGTSRVQCMLVSNVTVSVSGERGSHRRRGNRWNVLRAVYVPSVPIEDPGRLRNQAAIDSLQ